MLTILGCMFLYTYDANIYTRE